MNPYTMPLKVWVRRARNFRSFSSENDAPEPPCEGAEMLAQDTVAEEAFYGMTFFDLGHLLAFIDGTERYDGGPCQRAVLERTERMYADDMRALGVEPPEWTLTIYDSYLE